MKVYSHAFLHSILVYVLGLRNDCIFRLIPRLLFKSLGYEGTDQREEPYGYRDWSEDPNENQ